MTYDLMTTRKIKKTLTIKKPSQIHEFLKRYAKSKQEQFLVITLNGNHDIISIHIATIGLVNKTIAHVREVFIHAILDNASSIIIAHNHPSGNTEPSPEDIQITIHFKEAADLLGFNFLDHIIISKNDYYSFRQHQECYKELFNDPDLFHNVK